MRKYADASRCGGPAPTQLQSKSNELTATNERGYRNKDSTATTRDVARFDRWKTGGYEESKRLRTAEVEDGNNSAASRFEVDGWDLVL